MLANDAEPTYITLIENSKGEASVNAFLDKVNICIDGLLSNELGISYGNDYQHACPVDIVSIISEIDVCNHVELTVRNILLNAIISAEHSAVGAGMVAAIAFLEAKKSLSLDVDYQVVSGHTRTTDLKTAKSILRRLFGIDNKMYHMILKTCDIAGHNGQVYINNIPKDTSYIELTSGYRFKCHINKNFEHAAQLTKWSRSNVRVFVIDGIIENVSEINHILEYMSDSKEPGIIFARGYAEDVIATLAVNHKRKTLDVVPVEIPFDLQGMNMLKDLATVCGSDVTSSLKGDLISSINIDDIPTIDRVISDSYVVIIEHGSTQRHVGRLVQSLRARIEDESMVEDKIQLLNERIKALTANCIEVSLGPEYSKNIQLNTHRLTAGIQMMAEICRGGIIELEYVSKHQSDIASHVFKRLLDSNYHYISAMSGIHGIELGLKAFELINSVGAFIIRDH